MLCHAGEKKKSLAIQHSGMSLDIEGQSFSDNCNNGMCAVADVEWQTEIRCLFCLYGCQFKFKFVFIQKECNGLCEVLECHMSVKALSHHSLTVFLHAQHSRQKLKYFKP